MPLVSVVVATYNHKKFIEECINSILEQTFQDFEIVISDDCSTDGTVEILRHFKAIRPNIITILTSEKNLGITKNFNKALFHCSGKYISWMGGDDLMFPEKLEKQVMVMEQNPKCSICYHNMLVFGENFEMPYNKYWNKYTGNYKSFIKYGTYNCGSSTMTRNDFGKIKYDERLLHSSDWLFWIELVKFNNGVSIYIDEILGKYRRHEKNITQISNQISQNELDHLYTCFILLQKYPNEFNIIVRALSQRVFALRRSLNYISTVFLSFRIQPNIKNIFSIFIYVVTLTKVKL